MKKFKTVPSFAGTTALLLALACSVSLQSQTNYYWNVGSPGAGTGTWDTSSENWNTTRDVTTGNVVWGNTADGSNNHGEATFGGSAHGNAGTITVVDTVNVRRLYFGGNYLSSNYSFTGGTINIVNNVATQTAILAYTNATISIASKIQLYEGRTGDTEAIFDVRSGSTLTILGNIQKMTDSGTQSLNLRGANNSTTDITGNISAPSGTGVQLRIGHADSGNTARYLLGGSDNAGLSRSGGVLVNRGTLVLNHSNALRGEDFRAGAQKLTLTLGNVTTSGADTAQVLLGQAGLDVNNPITVNALNNVGDTNDVRTIGGEHTTGTATFSGKITLNAFAASGTGSRLEVTSAAGGTTVFSGEITDGDNTVPLLKTGDGIVKFARVEGMSYDGGTTVSAGALIVNNTSGSGTGSGVVAVNSGAIFGGAGIATGGITLDVGARLSPGDMNEAGVSSTGILTGGSLTWNSDGSAGLFFDLGADTASSDQLALSGAFTKGAGDSFVFQFNGATPDPSVTYTLITFGSTDFANASSFTSNIAGTFALSDNSLTFTASAIPEPAVFGAILGALVFAGGVFRRKLWSNL